MTKQFELTDTDLDVVTGGADAEQQGAATQFSDEETRQQTVTKIPGMHKFANVTLKRGVVK